MTTSTQYGLIRTIRVRNANVPGVLGALASAIGSAGANIGNLATVHIAQAHVVRDIDVQVQDLHHLEDVLRAVNDLPGVDVLETRDEVLGLHRGGKIRTVSRQPVDSIATLRKVYTPGVAEVCRVIAERPERKRLYTSISSTVAIVTDGTAVLGLGNIGLAASMPVMEGKAALLSQLSGISGVPLLVEASTVDEFVEAVVRVASTFGGIHLEDIASPGCFEIVDRLRERLPMPVMQDDQDGTAAVVLGAAAAVCRQLGRELSAQRIGQVGLGAAGQAIADLLMYTTGRPVVGADVQEERLDRHRSHGGETMDLAGVMASCDIVIATTGVPGLIRAEQVRKGQVILALSNPDPEIDPLAALEAGAAMAADGRAVNNVLGYPGIWRGALAAQATGINRAMLMAAGEALAGLAPAGELSPNPLDLEVHREVARSVGRAAVASGIGSASGLDELG
jgi:malate dehydrogenase (oxaloacetate-decarboxylating)